MATVKQGTRVAASSWCKHLKWWGKRAYWKKVRKVSKAVDD